MRSSMVMPAETTPAGMVARADEHAASSQHRHEVEHVVVVADEERRGLREAFGEALAGEAVELLHADEDGKDASVAGEAAVCGGDGVEVAVELRFALFGPGVEVDGPVVLDVELAGEAVGDGLGEVGLDRPPIGVDRAEGEHGGLAVPTSVEEQALADLGGRALEGPGGVGAARGADAEPGEHVAGGLVATDDEGAPAVLFDVALQRRSHVAGLGAVADGELVLGVRHAERTGHHGGEGAGELRLEHRAFAGDDAVVAGALLGEEGREDDGHHDLAHGAEIAAGELGVVGHDGQLQLVVPDDVAELADHLLDAHVGAGVAGADVAGEQQLERLARRPALGVADGITDADALDQGVHRHHEGAVGIERVADAVEETHQAAPATASSGQGR